MDKDIIDYVVGILGTLLILWYLFIIGFAFYVVTKLQ